MQQFKEIQCEPNILDLKIKTKIRIQYLKKTILLIEKLTQFYNITTKKTDMPDFVLKYNHQHPHRKKKLV